VLETTTDAIPSAATNRYALTTTARPTTRGARWTVKASKRLNNPNEPASEAVRADRGRPGATYSAEVVAWLGARVHFLEGHGEMQRRSHG
jgi:hypothetical protein